MINFLMSFTRFGKYPVSFPIILIVKIGRNMGTLGKSDNQYFQLKLCVITTNFKFSNFKLSYVEFEIYN